MYRRKEIELKTLDEINDVIARVEEKGYVWFEGTYEEGKKIRRFSLSTYACIDVTPIEVRITAKFDRIATYIFRLDGQQDVYCTSPLHAYKSGQEIYKVPKLEDLEWSKRVDVEKDMFGKYEKSAGALLWTNPEYDEKEVENVWIYDINSAYGAVLADKIPDLYKDLGEGLVQKDEVGFVDIGDKFALVEYGSDLIAEVRFKLIDSPYRTWVTNCFKLKEFYKSKWKENKRQDFYEAYMKYKQYINFFVGFTQRTNPFFRTYIVEKCNRFVKKLMNNKTIFCNTDSIHSAGPRSDLSVGSGLGQFKLEEQNVTARYKGANWQVAGQKPKWRGVPEYRLRKPNGEWINLLTDELPDASSRYGAVKTNDSWRIVDNDAGINA